MTKVKAGDTIKFGHYEQYNDHSNGPEEIEWDVLKKEKDRILIITKKGLDSKPYNTEYTSVTWETCTLRKWLNGEFLQTAFSEEEQKQISETSSSDAVDHDIENEYLTQDKVFLLSEKEADELYKTDEERLCKPTEYAIAQGVFVFNGQCGRWWIQSHSTEESSKALIIDAFGHIYKRGDNVNLGNSAVRPALWIRLKD